MRPDLMEILVCPVCKGELTLSVEQTATDSHGREEVLRGELHCAACDHRYRIDDGIPNLLPPELAEAPGSSRCSRTIGLLLMAGAALQLLVFFAAASRRSYAALALPVGAGLAAISALAFWIGYTMAYAEWDDDDPPAGA